MQVKLITKLSNPHCNRAGPIEKSTQYLRQISYKSSIKLTNRAHFLGNIQLLCKQDKTNKDILSFNKIFISLTYIK